MRVLLRAFVVFAVVLVVLGLPALAADEPMPWDELEITVGPVVLVWGAVVAAVVQLLKHVYFEGKPLLDTPVKIWAANLLLGGVGVFLYEVLSGKDVLAALAAAVVAVLTASGIFEGVKTAATAGKSSAANNHNGTG